MHETLPLSKLSGRAISDDVISDDIISNNPISRSILRRTWSVQSDSTLKMIGEKSRRLPPAQNTCWPRRGLPEGKAQVIGAMAPSFHINKAISITQEGRSSAVVRVAAR
jgi:hypothetical protein